MDNSEKNIGEPGRIINLSVASRAANIKPEPERIRKYDEYPAKHRRQKYRTLIWVLITLSITLKLIISGHVWWSLIPGIIVLWNIISLLLQKNVNPETVYTDGLLIPAIITSVSPLQIITMADVNRKDEDREIWGLKRFSLKQLPGHTILIGEKIPCAALFGAPLPFGGIWGEYEPRPLCWAVSDPNLINKAIQAIDPKEWETLNTLYKQALENEKIDKDYSYFKNDLTVFDPYDKEKH